MDGTCERCSRLHLSCPGFGSNARSAKPLVGYIRLGKEARAFKCLEPEIRCDAKYAESDAPTASNGTQDVGTTDYNYCSKGYKGTMCMECEANYFATRKACEKCADATTYSIALIIVVGITMVLAAVCVGIWLWMRRSTQAEVQLKEQLKAQVPILLQLCDSVKTIQMSCIKKDLISGGNIVICVSPSHSNRDLQEASILWIF